MKQLLRGAVASDLMLIQLCLRERKTEPPTFLQLLSEICAEEEYEASRMKLRTSVQQIQTKQAIVTKQAEIQSLKAEIKELKSIVAFIVPSETKGECVCECLKLYLQSHRTRMRRVKTLN